MHVDSPQSRNKRNVHFVTAPYRSSFVEAIIVLSTVILISLSFALATLDGTLKLAAIASLLFLAIVSRHVYAIHILILASLLLFLGPIFPLFQIWPLTLLGPLVIYGTIALFIPQLRHSIGWIRLGNIDAIVTKLIIAAIGVSCISLIGWVVFINPDITSHRALVPDLPFWAYPFAAIGFALLNSVMEEAVFRGTIMEATDRALGSGCWSNCIQAVPFAAFHYLSGFPNGISGFVMVLLYGVILGIIRRISKGIFAPIITHFAADIAIFLILMFIMTE